MKAFLEIGGASFTFVGVFVGVYGTFLMTKFYHPFGFFGFLKSMVRMLLRLLIFQKKKTEQHIDVASEFAKLSPEKKGESLAGMQWLFFGFALQTIGAALITINAFLLNLGTHAVP